MIFFSKCKYKVYKKFKISMANMINQSKRIEIYAKRVMNNLQH